MIVGVLAVVGLTAGFVTVAPSAYAHHSDVDLDAVCDTVTGDIDVTLRIYNSQGSSQPMTIDDVSAVGFSVPPAPGDGTVVPGGSGGNWAEWDFTLPGTRTGTISFSYDAEWANGVEDRNNHASADLPTDCDGPVFDCVDVAPGTELVAKYEVEDDVYVFEKPPGNETVVTLSDEDLEGGDWSSTIPIGAVIVKGGPNSDTTLHDPAAASGSFDNQGLPGRPDISNIQFCGDPDPRGSLDITKVVEGNSAPDGETYTVAYTGPESGQVELAGGETGTVDDLPYGTYTLDEVDPPPGAAVAISPNPVTVGATDPHVSVIVTNTFEDVGGFSVTKEVTGATGGYVAGSEFTVDWSCDDGSSGSLSLADGETDGAGGLPVGTTCSLEEVAKPATSGPSYAYGAESWDPSDEVTVAEAGQVVAVTLTNPIERRLGGLEISKAVVDATAGYVPGSAFGFALDCRDDTFDQQVSVAAGETATVDGIPLGTECTVSETELPAPAPGYEYGDPVLQPADGTVTVSSETEPVLVAVENPVIWLPSPRPPSSVTARSVARWSPS
ncbi:MAG: DUF5979 domain-containing protein [Acidimicrobiia bacterium]|nr:DUF5979 domain-containing protein [Acidimicrobiia bacterium]